MSTSSSNTASAVREDMTNFESTREKIRRELISKYADETYEANLSEQEIDDLVKEVAVHMTGAQLGDAVADRVAHRLQCNLTDTRYLGEKAIQFAVTTAGVLTAGLVANRMGWFGMRDASAESEAILTEASQAAGSPFADSSFGASPRPGSGSAPDNVLPFGRTA